LNLDLSIFRGRSVLVTGHTGFKGAWLARWLLHLGAKVTGYSLPPDTEPNLYKALALHEQLNCVLADIRDMDRLAATIGQSKPEFIFHLAAQPLVRRSYRQPLETYSTNLMGTLTLLEAIKTIGTACIVIVVTSDKCYWNDGSLASFSESDPLGGADPYSSSKAMVEMAVQTYRHAWFNPATSPIRLASARAGNVIGGGDWAEDRIVPDCVRALSQSRPIVLRNPDAVRPWQHVLEPLAGYLRLATCLAMADQPNRLEELCGAFNFGPHETSLVSVRHLVELLLGQWPAKSNRPNSGQNSDQSGTSWRSQVRIANDASALHEAKLLRLSIDKARNRLGWSPQWDLSTTVQLTAGWYAGFQQGQSAEELVDRQIAIYMANSQPD
jgi:CDP-glucose 4,6-dehydratase